MRIAMSLFMAATVFAAIPSADARKPFPVLRKIVKAGALEKSELDGVRALRKEFRACKKAVKAGQQPKGSCAPKRLEQVKAQIALIEKALPKIEKRRLQKKAKKALRKLRKRLTRLEAKVGAGAPKQ